MTTQFRSGPLNEASIVQNETLGAFAVWKYGLSYHERDGYPTSLPLGFLVLPLVLHEPTLKIVLSTNKASGLHLFVGKLSEKREDLLAVHSRAMALRQLTLRSLIVGEQSGLLRIDPLTATLWANGLAEGHRAPTLPERVRRIAPACERLGYWFAGFSDQQVANALRVEF